MMDDDPDKPARFGMSVRYLSVNPCACSGMSRSAQ